MWIYIYIYIYIMGLYIECDVKAVTIDHGATFSRHCLTLSWFLSMVRWHGDAVCELRRNSTTEWYESLYIYQAFPFLFHLIDFIIEVNNTSVQKFVSCETQFYANRKINEYESVINRN